MSSVLDVFDFIILAVLFSALTVCLLVYKGRRSKNFLFIGIYFFAQILLELDIRISEIDTPLTQWIGGIFTEQFTLIIKSLLYGIIIFVMLLVGLSILDLKIRPKYFIVPGIILFWLLISCTISSSSLIVYWMYLLPCEIFYFCISLFVLKGKEKQPDSDFNPELKTAMRVIMVFSIIIAVEDIVFGQYYMHLNVDYNGFTLPTADVYIKERSFSENILNIILAIIAIHAGGGILTGAERTASSSIEVKASADEFNTEAFARHLGLSPRECDVLPLLLSNMDINQISEALIISHGTVKSHTHNIYQKAGVKNRPGLIKLAVDFKA